MQAVRSQLTKVAAANVPVTDPRAESGTGQGHHRPPDPRAIAVERTVRLVKVNCPADSCTLAGK